MKARFLVGCMLVAPWLLQAGMEDLSINIVSTGNSSGVVAIAEVTNPGKDEEDAEFGPALVPGFAGQHAYLIPTETKIEIPAFQTASVPLYGFSADPHRSAIPASEHFPVVDSWIQLEEDKKLPLAPSEDSPFRRDITSRLLHPQTGKPYAFRLDATAYPQAVAPLLLPVFHQLGTAYESLRRSGRIQTSLSGDRTKEREAVLQIGLWLYIGTLSGREYTEAQLYEQMWANYQGNEDEEEECRFDDDVAALWEAARLTTALAELVDFTDRTRPLPRFASNAEDHARPAMTAVLGAAYGFDFYESDDAAELEERVLNEKSTAFLGRPPSIAIATWKHDTIGGLATAFARTVATEEEGVTKSWMTEPLQAEEEGNSYHHLVFDHGPDCSAIIAGATVAVVRAQSDTYDPFDAQVQAAPYGQIVNNFLAQLDEEDRSKEYAEIFEAPADKMVDPTGEAQAFAKGALTISLGNQEQVAQCESQASYQRSTMEDFTSQGGDPSCGMAFLSAVGVSRLAGAVHGHALVRAQATGSGIAETVIESVYGTLMVGVCTCGTGAKFAQYQDASVFLERANIGQLPMALKMDLRDRGRLIIEKYRKGDIPNEEALKAEVEAALKQWVSRFGHVFECVTKE